MAADATAPLSRLLDAHGHGPLARALALRGSVSLPSGTEAAAWLCSTDQGTFLVAPGEGDDCIVADVWATRPLDLTWRLLGDRLTVGPHTLTVPVAQRARARSLLAAGRISRAHPVGAGRKARRVCCGPWVQSITDAEQRWLDVALDAEETVLAWLYTSRTAVADDTLTADEATEHRFVLTDRRVALVAVSELGAVSGLVLHPGLLTVGPGRRAAVTCGDETWDAPGNADQFRALADLPAEAGADRLRAAAAAARDHGAEGQALLDHVLPRLVATGAPYDLLVAAGRAGAGADADLARAVGALPAGREGAVLLARWMAAWDPPLATAEAALRHLLAEAETPEEAAHSLSFHRTLRALQLAADPDPVAQAAADLSFAEHLLFVGEHTEARQILRSRQPSLPTSDLAAVLPPEDGDLASYGGVSGVLVQLLELLAAPGPDGRRDPSALAALARQQPLVHGRMAALAEGAAGDLQVRATEARTALEPDGLCPRPAAPLPTFRALPPPMLEVVRHPAARQGGVLARVQSAVARVKPPDVSAVRGFCERATLLRQPLLQRALTDACVLLGSPMASAYVSQGDQKVGLRSHEEPEPFLVIGGAHLDPNSDFFLPEAELRAAVGAEVAHLRFGHSRITSQDVWAGLMDKGVTALTTTAALLPFLRFLPVDLLGREKTWRVVNTLVPNRWLKSIYGVKDSAQLATVVPGNLARLGDAGLAAVDTAEGGLGAIRSAGKRIRPGPATPREENLGLDNVRLLAAHRVMQLTADRAGLVLSRDLRASIRALFLTHTRLAYELSVAEQMGLPACLDRRTDEDRLLLPDVAVRIAALVSFWLSDEYAQLQDAGTV